METRFVGMSPGVYEPSMGVRTVDETGEGKKILGWNAPPDLPGIPGQLARAAHTFRKVTQIFPPVGLGAGAGIGLGCGLGWPLRAAFGPPRAVCGASIGVGIGIGYGQGFGKRFGSDNRPEGLRSWFSSIEKSLDSGFRTMWSRIRNFGRFNSN